MVIKAAPEPIEINSSKLRPEERYELVVEHSRDIISTHTLHSDWLHTSINPAITEVLGYEKQEVIGKSTFELWHPDDIGYCNLNYEHTGPAASGKPIRFRLRHKQGHYLHFECVRRAIRDKHTGEYLELLCVSRDITDRIKAEEASQRLARVVESSSDLVVFFSTEFELSYANRSALNYFSMPELSDGIQLSQLFNAQGLEELRQAISHAHSQGAWQGQINVSRNDGYGEAVVHEIIYHEYTDTKYFSLIARDVSEQRKAEAEASAYRKHLLKAARLMSANELSTGIAHEINQPIAAISNFCHGALERIKAKPDDAATAEKALSAIKKQAERAGGIIKRIRSLLNKTTYQTSRFEVGPSCQELLESFKTDLASKGITLYQQYPAGVFMEADKVQLEQLLINLVINAIESLEESGQKAKAIWVEVHSEQDRCCLEVSDNCNKPLPDVDKVFEAYYSSKEQGLGIGLSMCKSIAEAHLGKIWMEERGPGLPGAKVVVSLPRLTTEQ